MTPGNAGRAAEGNTAGCGKVGNRKALPGTANLFMLRELLGIPPEEAALEEKTETREPDVQEKAETAGSLTAKQTWVLIAVMAILLWLALQFVGLGAAVGLLLLLLILIIVLF